MEAEFAFICMGQNREWLIRSYWMWGDVKTSRIRHFLFRGYPDTMGQKQQSKGGLLMPVLCLSHWQCRSRQLGIFASICFLLKMLHESNLKEQEKVSRNDPPSAPQGILQLREPEWLIMLLSSWSPHNHVRASQTEGSTYSWPMMHAVC